MKKNSTKQQAVQRHKQGALEAAKLLYEQYLDGHPDDDDALHALGVLLAQQSQFSFAEEKINAALQKNPKQITYLNSLGNVYRHLKRYDDAVRCYRQAIKINSRYAIAHNNLGNVFYRQKKMHAAEQAYQKAISLQPNYHDAIINLSVLADWYLCNDDYAKASRIFLQCFALLPDATDYLFRAGIAFFKQNNLTEAKIHFENVLMRDHHYPEANQYLAHTLLGLQAFDQAIHYYYRQLEQQPFFETYYNLGVLYQMKGRFKEGLSYFQQALLQQPNDTNTLQNMGQIYLKQNQLNDALRCYEIVLQKDPENIEARYVAAALRQENIPAQAPNTFISNLFDQYAAYYDQHLTKQLEYNVPEKLHQSLLLEYPNIQPNAWKIIDLGCGTGLCGKYFKPLAHTLIGIDLSEKMLETAKQTQCYDQLIKDDIETGLAGMADSDCIIAADVFSYIGDLSALFNTAKQALKKGGVFLFTVEKMITSDANPLFFQLTPALRYTHHQSYLAALIQEHGFELLRMEKISLRKQRGKWVEGYSVFLRV